MYYTFDVQAAANRFQDEIPRWFAPGAVYTFVGAGGKSTAMRRVASLLSDGGLRVRLTTTTRVGISEFHGWSVTLVGSLADAQQAVDGPEPVKLLAAGLVPGQEKYAGVTAGMVDALRLPADIALLVEGDGSRRLPLKVPRTHEPVIPSASRAVLAFVGASALDERVDERHCYNHQEALALLGRTASRLGAEELAALASHHHGLRKGVLPGMMFRLVINQGDLGAKRDTARLALRLAWERDGIEGALASFQEGELYGTSRD